MNMKNQGINPDDILVNFLSNFKPYVKKE